MPSPAGSWASRVAAAKSLVRPLGRFFQVESTSGIALLASALIALVWANSAWAEGYHALWHVSLGIRLAEVERDLHFFVNDVLMAIFFFVVGLEIRREIHQGELSEPKRAALPVIAAVGGMIVPALSYFALNSQGVGRRGWGVPMATDIAFAVGVLALLGKRIPAALRVLLLALAIIDDIGAIIVIAVFYSEGVSGIGLAIAGAGVAGIIGLQRLRVRTALAYLVPALLVWFGVLRAGVHPAIAGVIVGLLTPIAPAARLENALHPWVAFGIMPSFALANAGVSLSAISLDSPGSAAIGAGIVLGLVVGKPVGIVLVSLSAIRVGVCAAPRNVDWRGLLVVGCVAGVGFTMAIFIAGLAFARPDQLGIAKLAVLVASTASAVTGIVVAMLLLPRHRGAPRLPRLPPPE